MTEDEQGTPSKPLRRRRSFIGCDPEYTGAGTSGAPAALPEPETTVEPPAPRHQDVPRPAGADGEMPAVREEVTSPKATKPVRSRSSAPKLMAERASEVGEEKPRRDIVLRLRIGPDASAQLEELGRSIGQPTDVVLKHVRKAVVAEFRTLLDGKKRPEGGVTHRSGIPDAISITLQDHERERARAWFDPLGLGNSAMSDFARPVLTKLYEDTIRELAQR